MIELRQVSIISGGFRLEDVSFAVGDGEHVALMGRTGQGKTTILEAIAGLRDVTGGSILVAGEDVTRLAPARRGIGFVPQDLALFPTMTVRRHLDFALRLRKMHEPQIGARVETVAGWLGITHLLDRRVTTLSGGEAQRTALGRALSFEPRVLLLDEPMSALDEETRTDLHDMIRSIREKADVTTLHITHNRAEAEALADRIIIIENGRICG